MSADAGFDRAVAIVRQAYEAARAEPMPVRSRDPGERKIRGSALEFVSRAGRITALGAVLVALEANHTEALAKTTGGTP